MLHSPHNGTPRSIAAMEDTTMQDSSPGLFAELSFTICPNGLSEDRIQEVCDALRLEFETAILIDSVD